MRRKAHAFLAIMSIFPITPLVRDVQRLIVATFEVSNQEAENYAAEMVSLAEGWGSREFAAQMDWAYRVKKDLGETRKLKWRSEEARLEFEKAQKQEYAAYESYIQTQRLRDKGQM